jgi:FkbM family methyltransferase
MNALKRTIKKVLLGLGLELHRFDPAASKTARLVAALDKCGIDTILDIGANEGQFGEELRAGGYTGSLISFEPMVDAHGNLEARSKGDARWQVAPRCAIGASRGTIVLNVSANSVSSSVLPMLEAHRKAAPDSAYSREETVPMLPLDVAAAPLIGNEASILLKIDTQGYEWQVLDGAAGLLVQARAVMLELSLVPLYEGQHLWLECIARLEAMGFTLWALEPVFIDRENGRTLQMDGLFIRA